MANGITHGRITIVLAPVTAVSTYLITQSSSLAAIATVGTIAGLVLEPDLDIDQITMSERRVYNLWSPLGTLWRWCWLPYAYSIPHRSILSHLPILGTAIRLLYLWLVVTAVVTIFSMPGLFLLNNPNLSFVAEWFEFWKMAQSKYLIWFFVGLVASDCGHWVADVL